MSNKIILTSANPVKIQVVQKAIDNLFFNQAINLLSLDLEEKGAEPFGEDAIISQITSSIQQARQLHPNALYYIGMEGGIVEKDYGTYEAAFAVVENNTGEIQGISQSVSFPIPNQVAELVKSGVPFGKAVDQIFNTTDIKTTKGFIGLLTNDLVDKQDLYYQPTIVAFSKLTKDKWYNK